MSAPVLYLFASAAPPVFDLGAVVADAHKRGWQVCVGLTPTAADWLGAEGVAELEALTGRPVRTRYKRPGEPDAWPKADAILFAPLTMNSLNSWALGLTSNFVIGVAAEALGKRIPLIALPCINAAYAQHPQFAPSLATLRTAGARILYGEGGFHPNPPGQGGPTDYPWHMALDAADEARG